MESGVHPLLDLVCGYCPNRRTLTRLSYHSSRLEILADPPVEIEEPTLIPVDRNRPSVRGGVTADRPAAGESMRFQCRKGHLWTLPQEELLAAYNRAVAANRREIVAGVDLARDPRGGGRGLPRRRG
jgi:hypothetical protein